MKSWKRKVAMVIAGAATVGTVGMAAPANAVSTCSGTVFYADPSLIQVEGTGGMMEFYYLDEQTVFNDGLALEVLEGRQVYLRVNENSVVAEIDADGVFEDPVVTEPAPEPAPEPEAAAPGSDKGAAVGIENGRAAPPAHGVGKGKAKP